MWHHGKNSALRTTSFRCTYKNQNFFWFTSNAFLKRPVSLNWRLLRPFSTKKTTCKSSTIEGLLYAPDPEERKKGTLIDWPRLLGVTSTVLLCCWGRQLLKDMMYFGTDFEMHAIWQGYIEDPAAKDFVARKARTIAVSKAQGTQQSILFTSLDIPWGFLTQTVLRSLAGLMSCEKVSVQGFLWVRKVWLAFAQQTFALETLRKRRKGEKSPVVSLLPVSHEHLASRNPRVLCQKYGGRMYNVPAWSAKSTRNRTRNRIPVQPRKARRS
jgi:hypothetical protein